MSIEADTLRVAVPCTGLGRQRRGFESFTRELHAALRSACGMDLAVYGGGGDLLADERAVWNLPRTSSGARVVARLTRRGPYFVEQATFFAAWLPRLLAWRPHVVYFSDLNLGNACWHWRRITGQQLSLVYCNGGPTTRPFTRCDWVHQVTPAHFASAVARGESAERMFVLPYGVALPAALAPRAAGRTAEVRRAFGVPDGRKLLLAVGMLGAERKRMDALIDAVRSMGDDRPFLVLLGQETPETPALRDRARSLGGDVWMGSWPHDRMSAAYAAADAFALLSFEEGFGLAYVEALAAGLPIVAHDSAVTRYVLGNMAYLGDTSHAAVTVDLIRRAIGEPSGDAVRAARHRWAFDHFSWDVLAPRYADMLRACARGQRPTWADA